MGIAVGGWPGGIEPATAVCRLDSNGKLTVVLGSVDLTGTNTTFAQIAAETFGMSADEIEVNTAATDAAPFAGGTGGSKITYTVGMAVQRAAEDARRQILAVASEALEASVEDLEIADGMVQVRGVPGSGISLKDIANRTMGFAARNEPVYGTGSTAIRESAPGFAVHLVEVEVDEVTGETRPVRYVAVQDVGFAINPAEVEAQIHGGVAQGLGWALYEGMVYDSDGQLLTATLMDYALPRAEMVPPIETVLVEVPAEHGAYGAKGIGEPPAIPGAATVANAIRDVTGRRILSIPIRPEDRGRSALGTVLGGGRLMRGGLSHHECVDPVRGLRRRTVVTARRGDDRRHGVDVGRLGRLFRNRQIARGTAAATRFGARCSHRFQRHADAVGPLSGARAGAT